MAENLIEVCSNDAMQCGLLVDGKIQVSFFLQRLLFEF